MAVPQVNGSFSAHNGGSGMASYSIDISTVPNGAWMVVSIMMSVSSSFTTPAGWTTLASGVQSGTRTNFLYAKIRASEDGNTATFTAADVANVAYSLLWGTGADSVSNWAIGSGWLRTNSAQPSGARYDNIALSVPTTKPDSLVLAISHEATLAMTQSNEIASFSPSGWNQNLWLPQIAPDDRAETIWMATKPMPSTGNSGNVTISYLSPQNSNGWAIQLVIPSSDPAPAITPTSVISTTTFAGNTFTNFTINRPAGAQTGDYVVVVIRGQSSTTSAQPASSGFTRLGPAFVPSSTSYRLNGFYGRPIEDIATEPTSYTFAFTATDSNTRLIAVALLVRGVNIEAPLAGYYDSYNGTSITGGGRVESYALASTPAFSLFSGAAEFTAGSNHTPTTTPVGYKAEILHTSSDTLTASRTGLWIGSKEQGGASVPSADIIWGSPTGAAVEGIALRTVDSPTPDPAGDGYEAVDGTGDPVKMYHTSEDGVRTPSKVVPMRRGFNTVAEMLATPGFTWAHRGGSASYPEHSLYAFTQAVARGYGVLEVSLGRTSDGVWFGLHDQTTDHTSGGTYGNASSQTWAQIQMQNIVVGATGAPQPYMRLDELIAIYGSTHLFVLDPKFALGSYRAEFLTMVNTLLGPTRAIIKYSGAGSGAAALSNAAKAMGYETWGFFYATDASAALGGTGALQTWGPSWTLIGMAYGASQEVWEEAKALGKPIIGHIAPNQAAYNTAMAKGAIGVQVSGVAVVEPVSWWTQ